jgi:hypothetical protein
MFLTIWRSDIEGSGLMNSLTTTGPSLCRHLMVFINRAPPKLYLFQTSMVESIPRYRLHAVDGRLIAFLVESFMYGEW